MTSSLYFSEKEMACRCGCGDSEMDKGFLAQLDTIRAGVGHGLTLTSAKRCKSHNANVSTVGGSSPHLLGIAADILAGSSAARFAIVTAALAAGITRIGIAKGFVHVDSGKEVPHVPNLIWIYQDR